MTNASAPLATIVLAAGSSSRLGHPKQLVLFRGTPLVAHAATTAMAAALGPVFVVLGAHEEIVAPALAGLRVDLVSNARWADGMGTSIAAGLAALQPGPAVAGVVLMVCDQPHVTPAHLAALAETFGGGGASVIASRYPGSGGVLTDGVPALFARELFGELAGLPGDRGAKPLIERHRADLAVVTLARGEVDVDTPADVASLARETGRR